MSGKIEPPIPERKAFSINEICAQFGLGRNTVYDAISRGELETIKIGRRRLSTAKQIDRWVKLLEEKAMEGAA